MGFVLLRRCEHPGCDVVLRVSQVEGLKVQVLHEWWGDSVRVEQGAEEPYPEEPRFCDEHQPGVIAQVVSTARRSRRRASS